MIQLTVIDTLQIFTNDYVFQTSNLNWKYLLFSLLYGI